MSGRRIWKWIGGGAVAVVVMVIGSKLLLEDGSGEGTAAYARPLPDAGWVDNAELVEATTVRLGAEEAGRRTRARTELDVRISADAKGYSGELVTVQALPSEPVDLALDWNSSRPAGAWYRWVPNGSGSMLGPRRVPFGDDGQLRAPADPGIYQLEVGSSAGAITFDEPRLIVKVPFDAKQGARLQGYLIGRFPTEGQGRTDRYAPPDGFIEVHAKDRSLRLSKHFTLGEFLTKDQHNVWPKYVVVDPLLLDKLELVMQELNGMGVRAERMVVMSGFRTPQYNRRGLNQGRANLSRHQYGDAADVWIDNEGEWYMSDLNGDGRRDTRDARVMLEAVERIERRYPALLGGAGVYPDNGVHGPFIHIDVRGTRARW